MPANCALSAACESRCWAPGTLLCSPLRRPRAKGQANGVERSVELTADGLWSEVAGRLKEALNDTTYRTWFAAIEAVELTDDGLVVAAPNNFTREWIEGHFLDLVRAAVRGVNGEESEIRITVRASGEGTPAAAVPQPVRRPAADGALNPRYTFDLFVIG